MSQKTVREIIEMIDNGELHYNQSTQRKFIYADLSAQLKWGKTTKAGSVIHSILEDKIQLPGVYFFRNTDTGQLNIHDGKQRILSIYYFIKPTLDINISTIRNGRTTSYEQLSEEDKETLLNYEFNITENEGTSEEEERSFYLINTNSVNLTKYESISGMLYGSWLTGFERFIEQKSKTLTGVNPIGRGEQARLFLYACFNRNIVKDSAMQSNPDSEINNDIRAVRNTIFEATNYGLDKILDCFSNLSILNIFGSDEKAVRVANYIVREVFDIDRVCDLYRRSSRVKNDISKWDFETHKTFIIAYVQDGIELDPTRMFTDDDKQYLYDKEPRCSHMNEDGSRCPETSYKKLEVDHIIPWSKGGRTTRDNAQLLCKSHNASKGNR